MVAAKYYILAKTLYSGDEWGAIEGPISDKNEAMRIAGRAENDGINSSGQKDLKSVVNTIVVNTTTMARVYGIREWRAVEAIHFVRIQNEQASISEEEYAKQFEVGVRAYFDRRDAKEWTPY